MNIYRSDNKDLTYEQIYEWISGNTLNESNFRDFNWSKLYYELPLVINTFSKICAFNQYEDYNMKLQEFNELIKYGLPNLEAVKIYLMGLNSREVAIRISDKYRDLIRVNKDKLLLKTFLIRVSADILEDFRETEYFTLVKSWYENELVDNSAKERTFSFRLKNIPEEIKEFRLVEKRGVYYLSTLDLYISYQLNLLSSDLEGINFAVNQLKYSFKRNGDDSFILNNYGN